MCRGPARMKKLRNTLWLWSAQFVVAACALLIAVVGVPAKAAPEDYWKALQAIARDIAKLETNFPQLKDFSPTKNADIQRLALDVQKRQRSGERSESGGLV
jgi:hypothetical protein